MKLTLFEYAVVWHPSDEQLANDPSLKTILVTAPTALLADNKASVIAHATERLPTSWPGGTDQFSILVRKF